MEEAKGKSVTIKEPQRIVLTSSVTKAVGKITDLYSIRVNTRTHGVY